MAEQVPQGRDAERLAIMQLSKITQRGGAAVARRRGSTMGSRVTTSKTKEAVYPLFLELSKSCASIDTFWQRFFETMSNGRFPKGVVIRGDCLIHRSRKKTTVFELNAEARSNWQNVADFFRTTCDIRSERDWALRKGNGEVVVLLTTAQINKRVKKEHVNAIPEFTLALKARYGLSPAEMSEADVLLRFYSSSNLFRPGDVIYGANGAIKEIKTLVFDANTRRFSVTAEAKAPRYSMKESYQDPITYLSGNPFTKSVERKIGFDTEIRKQLEQLYAPQIAAREKMAAIAAMPPSSAAAAAIKEEDVLMLLDDDEETPAREEKRHHRQSDEDSS